MKKTAVLVIFMFQLLIVVFYPLVSSQAKVLIVDCNGNGDYYTISKAIENAADGDIIRVWNGTYIEDTIRISKSISIIGNGTINTVIRSSGGTALKIYSPDVYISELSIVNTTESAIHIGENAKNVTLSDVEIISNEGNGIVVGASDVLISRCTMKSKTSYSNGVVLQSSCCRVIDCKISGYANGLLLIFEKTRNNMILNDEMYNNSAAGVDIRLGANNNTIAYCSIHSNTYGVYIQQDSNGNVIHHNNFFNNHRNAFDNSINKWCNISSSSGNYWDDYNGFDTNNDGIGDIPYNISGGSNRDIHPLMTAIGSNKPSSPTNVRCITNETDNTPTFTWNPSYHHSGIKGYYVKIDNNPEISIGNVLNWTPSSPIKDGSHIFYIRAESNEGTSSKYVSCMFTIDTSKIDRDRDGWTDKEEEKYGTDLNDPNSYPSDVDNDHIPDAEDKDNDNDGYNDKMEYSYGTNPFDPYSHPKDTDNDGIPDENSPDNNYTGDIDDDNDGLPDEIENIIGTNPKWNKDVEKITIEGKNFYLVDQDNDTIYDTLYNPEISNFTNVAKKENFYLLDINGDKKWDYLYEVKDKTFSKYKQEKQNFLIIVLPLITLFSILSLILFFKKRKLKKHMVQENTQTIEKEDFEELIQELRKRFNEEYLISSDSRETDTTSGAENETVDISEIEREIDRLINHIETLHAKEKESND